MSEELIRAATRIVGALEEFDAQRRRVGREGLDELERLDPETARLVRNIWGNSERAVYWFMNEVEFLDWLTPWQCIAQGRRWDVQIILNNIARNLHD